MPIRTVEDRKNIFLDYIKKDGDTRNTYAAFSGMVQAIIGSKGITPSQKVKEIKIAIEVLDAALAEWRGKRTAGADINNRRQEGNM